MYEEVEKDCKNKNDQTRKPVQFNWKWLSWGCVSVRERCAIFIFTSFYMSRLLYLLQPLESFEVFSHLYSFEVSRL